MCEDKLCIIQWRDMGFYNRKLIVSQSVFILCFITMVCVYTILYAIVLYKGCVSNILHYVYIYYVYDIC